MRTDPSLPDEAEVDFSPALQAGQSAYFSLEGALQYARLAARQGPLQGTVIHYVAMGDSFSSGESNPPYQKAAESSIVSPTDNYNSGGLHGCHRSNAAYPEVMKNDPYALDNDGSDSIKVDLQFIACTGATTEQMLSGGSHNEIAQEQQLQIVEAHWGQAPDLVTWTAAGDDVGFAQILSHCLWRDVHFTPCADQSSFVKKYQNKIDSIEPVLQDNYAQLAAGLGPDTSVMIADYPQIFPADASSQNCSKLSPFLSGATQDLFRQWTVDLDIGIANAVAADGYNFVDVETDGAFDDGAICDGSPDFNAVTDNNTSIWQRVQFWHTANYQGSFHPNAPGQQAYAGAFDDYITNARDTGAALTPAGLPANPGPPHHEPGDGGGGVVPSLTAAASPAIAPASTAPDVDTAGGETLGAAPLTVTTLLPDDDVCANAQTYQGGQTITVTGGGFAPGAQVSVALQPDTAGQVTQDVTADATGQISLTMRLPLGLTGPQPQADFLPIGYVEANGAGATSTSQMDDVMFNIAPHGSTCGPTDALPFDGFNPPVRNAPTLNNEHPGRTLPVKFDLPVVPGTVADALWPGYPQSTPVTCDTLTPTGPASPTEATSSGSQSGTSDHYNYLWSTDPTWTGCRELDVRLADGSDHLAYFDFGGG